MDEQNEELEVDLIQLLQALWHRAWVIVLAAVFGAAALFSYARFFITPLYEAETLMYVNNSSFSAGSTSFSITPSELTAAKNLVDTYTVILKTRRTLNDVIEQADLDYSYEQLKTMISAAPVNNTEVFNIKVTSPDPREAELIANTIAEILPNKIADIVDGSSVRIVDYAIVPSHKASPSITKYTAIGMVLGVVLSCAVIVVLELLDTQIHSEDYLMKTYGLPVLAVIPDLTSAKNRGYYHASNYNTRREENQE